MATDDSKTRIGLNTWISGGILLAAIGGTGTVVKMASDLSNGLVALTMRADQTQASVEQIESAVESLRYGLWEAANDRWTGSDMTRWAFELQRANPQVAVPKVGHDPALAPANGR